jgi:hypothetical protein
LPAICDDFPNAERLTKPVQFRTSACASLTTSVV